MKKKSAAAAMEEVLGLQNKKDACITIRKYIAKKENKEREKQGERGKKKGKK